MEIVNSKQDIYALIPVNIKKNTSINDLEEVLKIDNKTFRKRFFKFKTSSGKLIFLTYGKDLCNIYNNSKLFHQTFSDLVPNFIFISYNFPFTLYGNDFIEGKSLEHLYNLGQISHIEISNIIEDIFLRFKSTEIKSTIEEAQVEFKNFCKSFLTIRNWKPDEILFFKNHIFPHISMWITTITPKKRWAQGDLTTSNILISKNKKYKLIDFEFSNLSHFYDDDWIGLSEYSNTELITNNDFIQKLLKQIPYQLKIYHYLKQIILDKGNYSEDKYQFYIKEKLFKILEIIYDNKGIHCLFKEAIFDYYRNSYNNLVDKSFELESLVKKYKDLETELIYSKYIISKYKNSFLFYLSKFISIILIFINFKRYKRIFRSNNTSKISNFKDNNILNINYDNLEKIQSCKFYFDNTKTNLNLLWLIPDFTIGSGGHNTIFRTIFWLEKFGHNCDILICGKSHFKSKDKAKKTIISHYFPLKASIDFLDNPQNFKSQNDVIISTSFDTCYYSTSLRNDSKRFYFIQDFEPDFSAFGTYYFMALNTYAFGFHCITAGQWLAKKVKEHGALVEGYFQLGVDKEVFNVADNLNPKSSVPKIAVYSRSATPRRMSELIILGLNILHKFRI